MKKQRKTGKNINCYQCKSLKYFPNWEIKQKKKRGHKNFFCSKECYHKSMFGKKLSEKTKKKMSLSHKGIYKTNGVYKNGLGYVMVHSPNHPNCENRGYVREHRLVMEKHLKRLLSKTEVVHHKNGIKDDNRIENLELFESHSSHMRLHKNALKTN